MITIIGISTEVFHLTFFPHAGIFLKEETFWGGKCEIITYL